MDFFDRQRAARGTTVRLVLLFTLAVLSIVVVNNLVILVIFHSTPVSTLVGYVIAMTIFTLLIIGGGTASKMIALRAGGAAVAQSVGAVAVDPSTTDPRLRRLVNVVEEMSIASGYQCPGCSCWSRSRASTPSPRATAPRTPRSPSPSARSSGSTATSCKASSATSSAMS